MSRRFFGIVLELFAIPLALGLLEGCACRKVVRTYPICLYDTSLGAAQEAEANWPTLRSELAEAAVLVTRNPANVVIVNSRTAVVRTTSRRHSRLQSIWPPIACYGKSGGAESGQMLAICMAYVKAYLQFERSGQNLPSNVTIPTCQTLPGGPPATSTPRQSASRLPGLSPRH